MKSAFLLTLFFILSVSKELPSFIEKCSLSADNVGDCIIDRVNKLKPRLVDGIPELKIPSTEPLYLPKFVIETGKGSNVEFKAEITKVNVKGLKDLKLVKYIWGVEKNFMEIAIEIQLLHVVGEYDVNGKVLLFNLQAKGAFVANISNIEGWTRMKTTLAKKNDKEYVTISLDDIETKNTFGAANIYFENLFENEEINKQVNSAINQNIAELAKEVSPLIHSAVHKVITGIVNPTFSEYSLDELFVK